MVLGRNAKQYWHLMRTMVTQLVENDRIKTTKAKAKHLHPLGEYIIRHAKRASTGNRSSNNIIARILRTKLARQKTILELAERFKSYESHFTRVSQTLYRRRGDNAPMVTIEYRGNNLPSYPKVDETFPLPDTKGYKATLFNTRKQMLEAKLDAETDPKVKLFLGEKIRDIQFQLRVDKRKNNTGPIFTYYN